MSLYQRARKEEKTFIALTGLTFQEFDKLLIPFDSSWQAELARANRQGSSRQRQPGGGQKPALTTPEDRLFFILYYMKTYPLQEVIAFHFERSQGQWDGSFLEISASSSQNEIFHIQS